MTTDSVAENFALRSCEVLLSLNVGFAVIFSLWTFVHRGNILIAARYFLLPADRLFVRWAADVNRSLHLDRRSNVGSETALVAFVFAIAILVFLFLRLVARTRLGPTILDVGGELTCLALVPALWLHAYQASWEPHFPVWKSLFIVEVPLACALLFVGKRRRFPLWVSALILTLHYAWWLGWMWGDIYWAPWDWPSPLWVPAVFFIVFPGSGFAWLLHVRPVSRESQAAASTVESG